MKQTKETDEKRTGLQNIADKALDLVYLINDTINDIAKTEIPSPQFIQRNIGERRIRYNLHKRMFKYYKQEEILQYLDSRSLIEKAKGFVPLSDEYAKQSAAEEVLLEKLRGL